MTAFASLVTAATQGDATALRAVLLASDGVTTSLLSETDAHGRTALSLAAASGSAECVDELLRLGAAVDVADASGRTPLTYAASAESAAALLRGGASVDARDAERRTPLHHATEAKRASVVTELLRSGADVNATGSDFRFAIDIATANGCGGAVSALAAHGANVNSLYQNGFTNLMYAAQLGHAEVVAALLKHGAHVDATSDGKTALAFALTGGSCDSGVVRELLHHGADANFTDMYRKTPLTSAASEGQLDLVLELLRHGVAVHARDGDGGSALLYAAERGHLEVVAALLAAGAAQSDAHRDGELALERAACCGHLAVVVTLLESGVAVNCADAFGQSPLMSAASRGHLAVVKELLARGAAVDAMADNGDTVLSRALYGSDEVMLELLEHGADINAPDSVGCTALMCAGRPGTSKFRLLLERGAAVHVRDKDGRTAVSYAAESGNVEMMQVLVSLGLALDEKATNGRSLLSYAADYNHTDAVAFLVQQGVPVDEKDDTGRTALSYTRYRAQLELLFRSGPLASRECSDAVVNCFVSASLGDFDELKTHIESGVSVDVATFDGRTPLFYAAERGKLHVVEYLLAAGASVRVTASDPIRMNRVGDTPLTIAGRFGHMDVFQTLLDAGAPVNVRGDDGETPLLSLTRYNYFTGVQQLIALMSASTGSDASKHETSLLPGTLKTMRAMCGAVFEFEAMCTRVLDRLAEICSELQQRAESGAEESLTVSFAGIVIRFCRLLLDVKTQIRPTARLAGSRSIAGKVEAFHDEINHFTELLGTADASKSWRTQLEEDRALALRQLLELLENDDTVAHKLFHRGQYEDASLRLQSEIKFQGREGNADVQEMLTRVHDRLLRVTGIQAPELPEWFVSPEDLEYYEWNFKRGLGAYHAIKWYEGTWRKTKVMIETTEYADLPSDASQWFQLRHPNVVKLLGACATSFPTFVVFELGTDAKFMTEYLSGVSDALERVTAAWKCLHDAALGLQYLHGRGIVHKDVQDENIVVGSDSTAKLSAIRVPRSGQARWLAPETAWKSSAASSKSDIFALGMCIWEAVTGVAPTSLNGSVPDRPDGIDDEVWNLITRMCAVDPSERVDIVYVVSRLKQFMVSSRKREEHGERDGGAESVGSDASLASEDRSLEGHAFTELEGATIPNTLRTVRMRCEKASEEQWMGSKVLPTLEFIYSLLQARGKSVDDFEVVQFCNALLRFQRYLRTAVSEKSVFELARSRQVAESHHVIYAELDRLLDAMSVASNDTIRSWRGVSTGSTESSGGDESNRDDAANDASDSRSYMRKPNESSSAVTLHHFDLPSVNHAAWTRDGLASAVADCTDGTATARPSWHLALRDLVFSEADKIGQGAFGAVYRGSWLDTPVVVKFMGYEEDAGMLSTDLLLHEVRVWHRLNHPHVLKLYGANHVDKRYFVCEFAGNGDLLAFLRRPGNERKAWQMMHEAALGLEYLHETHRVAHHDLKCDNIMVGADGKAKLIDFGLSALVNEAEVQIDVKRMGAVHWRSPEYLAGGRPSFASDVYSFAMCLVEAVGGDIPWGKNMAPVMVKLKVKRGNRPPLPAAMNEKQKNLVELMTKSDPAERVKIGFVVDKLREIAQEEAAQHAP